MCKYFGDHHRFYSKSVKYYQMVQIFSHANKYNGKFLEDIISDTNILVLAFQINHSQLPY